VVTIHDVFHLKFLNTLSLAQKIYAQTVLNAAAKMSDHLITVSYFSKKEILQYIKLEESKISVVYNGVGKAFLDPKNELKKEDLQKKYKLPAKYILFVGNLKPHKNISNLITAISLLKKDPSWEAYKLVIVGKRKGFITGLEGLDTLIHNLDLDQEVLFLETVETSELPLLYSLASLLVFPSFYEGFGLPPLEAMACECPTLVSDIDCLKEIYKNNSFYISPSEPKSIENGIREVLMNEDLRKNLIEKGKTYAKKFTWEASANEHLHIFDKVLNK
jgi:glycosyltransferase involved in cell wall biosynthesis